MFFKSVPLVGLCIALGAWPLAASHAQTTTTSVTLSSEQAIALGVRTTTITDSASLKVGTHGRVVFKPDAQYVVAAPYAGLLPRVLVSVGQTVKTGQPLGAFVSAQLSEASRELSQAQSQARLARQSLDRDKALFDDGIIAASRWEATQARAAEAASTLQARQAELASTGISFAGAGREARLIAPRDGVVSEVYAVAGARVEASSPLFRIVDPSALELDLLIGRKTPVPAIGDRIDIDRRGAAGAVIGVAPSGDGSAGVRVRASLQPRGDLRAGESVNATIDIRGTGQAATAARLARVPMDALAYVRGRPGLFVATDKGFRFQEVEVASTDDATAVVRAPWPRNSRVAVSGVGALKGMLTGEP